MAKPGMQVDRLLNVGKQLGDAAIDPNLWPDIMAEISAAVGATGAALLQGDVRTEDIPRTAGVSEVFGDYFANGWHKQDIRAERGVPLLLRGAKVISDQDILTPEEMGRHGLYMESLGPHGFRWFAAIGFWAGSALWGLSIQRTISEGPFDADAKSALAQLADRLTETATLSKTVGRAVLTGISNALNLVNEPAMALDRRGFVIETNAAAERLCDDEIRVREGRLFVRDQKAKSALDTLIDQLRITPDTAVLPVAPIVVRRTAKRSVIIRVLPVDGALRSPFLGARALLIFDDLNSQSRPQHQMLSQAFGLSRSEARLASILATGASLEQAAEELGLARETVRNQLKSVFSKTATHRQGELIALLSRLRCS